MEQTKAEAIIEAILFAMGSSVSLEKLAETLELDKKETRGILEHMKEKYQAQDRGIELVELEGSYQLGTKGETFEYLSRIARIPQKYVLTDTVLETLSIIAYKQPVTRGEIEKIRGVSCDHAVNKLLEYDLIEEVGRLDAPGRPLLFGTTEQFLRSFGVSSIQELPKMNPELMADFTAQAEEEISMKVDV